MSRNRIGKVFREMRKENLSLFMQNSDLAAGLQQAENRIERIEQSLPPFILGAKFVPVAEWEDDDNLAWVDVVPDGEPLAQVPQGEVNDL